MEWMCAKCGEPHAKNNPPCKKCGSMQFQKTVVRQEPETDDVGPASIEWECTECERTSPKNNPPCSRCGSMHLEAVELGSSFDDSETSAGLGLGDVAKFVGALAVVAVLIFAGINSGILEQGAPTVENVPGEADESSDIDLGTVEYQIYDEINEERSTEGYDSPSLESEVTDIADYYNKLTVKRGEYPLDRSSDDIREEFRACSEPHTVYNRFNIQEGAGRSIDHHRTEEQLSIEITDSWFGDREIRPAFFDGSDSKVGIDVHVAENGDIYATVVLC